MNTNNRLPSGDEMDRLLTAYYKAEMPSKWPAAPRPWAEQAQVTHEQTTNTATRSRWALAASVALLIGSCWYLSGQVTDGKKRPDVNFDGGTADSKHVKDAGKDKTKTP